MRSGVYLKTKCSGLNLFEVSQPNYIDTPANCFSLGVIKVYELQQKSHLITKSGKNGVLYKKLNLSSLRIIKKFIFFCAKIFFQIFIFVVVLFFTHSFIFHSVHSKFILFNTSLFGTEKKKF